MAFQIIKKLDLNYLGEGWANGTYLKFSGLTFSETREFAKIDPDKPDSQENLDIVMEMVKRHFLEGKGFDGTQLVDITADELENLPVDVITKAIELLAGTTDPKS